MIESSDFQRLQTGWSARESALFVPRYSKEQNDSGVFSCNRIPADLIFTDLKKNHFDKPVDIVGVVDQRDGTSKLLSREAMEYLTWLQGKSLEDSMMSIQDNQDLYKSLYDKHLIIPPGFQHQIDRSNPKGTYPILNEWINPNRECSSACVFCFAGQAHPEKRKEIARNIPPRMPESVMRLIIEDMPRSAEMIGASHIHLKIGGGGEPALAMQEVMQFLDIVDTELPENYTYDWTLVTSGLGLNAAKLEEIKRRNGYIALSIGGDEEGHNKSRPLKGGLGSYQRVIKILELIKSMGIPLNLSMVFNADNIATAHKFLEEIYANSKIGWVPIITSVVRDNSQAEGTSFVPTNEALIDGWQKFLNVMLEGAIRFKQPIPPHMDYVSIGAKKEHTCVAGVNYIAAGSQYGENGDVIPLINSCHVTSSDANIFDSEKPYLQQARTNYETYLPYKTDEGTGCRACEIQGWCGGGHEAGGCPIQKKGRDTIKPPYCDFYTQGTEMLMQAVLLADYYNEAIEVI